MFRIDAEGVGACGIATLPKRNRFGLSSVTGTVRAARVHHLVLRPADKPCVLRIDRIVLRCRCQNEEEPLVVVLDGPTGLARLRQVNCFLLQPNVVIAHGSAYELWLSIGEFTPRVVFRVDVEVAFAIMPSSQVLPAGGRFANLEEAAQRYEALEEQLAAVKRTVAWRITEPARKIKRRLR